jgi:hypothetical protein
LNMTFLQPELFNGLITIDIVGIEFFATQSGMALQWTGKPQLHRVH